LHGGADEAALKMMYAIGEPDNTEKYILEALEGKQRIMGFGHRVYKVYDPRAKIVREYLEKRLQEKPTEEVRKLLQIALRAEKLMIEKLGNTKGIWPNIDFFAGPLYRSVTSKLNCLHQFLFHQGYRVGAHTYWNTGRTTSYLGLLNGTWENWIFNTSP